VARRARGQRDRGHDNAASSPATRSRCRSARPRKGGKPTIVTSCPPPDPPGVSSEQTVYLDQFTGKKLAQSDTASFGKIGQVTKLGVLTHMGIQFRVLDRFVIRWARPVAQRLGLPPKHETPSPA
jgi:uncharacterized iron-regulated membrane protein